MSICIQCFSNNTMMIASFFNLVYTSHVISCILTHVCMYVPIVSTFFKAFMISCRYSDSGSDVSAHCCTLAEHGVYPSPAAPAAMRCQVSSVGGLSHMIWLCQVSQVLWLPLLYLGHSRLLPNFPIFFFIFLYELQENQTILCSDIQTLTCWDSCMYSIYNQECGHRPMTKVKLTHTHHMTHYYTLLKSYTLGISHRSVEVLVIGLWAHCFYKMIWRGHGSQQYMLMIYENSVATGV